MRRPWNGPLGLTASEEEQEEEEEEEEEEGERVSQHQRTTIVERESYHPRRNRVQIEV